MSQRSGWSERKVNEQKNNLFCFADIDVRNPVEESCRQIRKMLAQSCFRGIKIHPENSGMNIDDRYNDMIAECAVELNCPVAVHSYPSSKREQDRSECCSPMRIEAWMKRHPGLKVIVCHLGGFQWEGAWKLEAYFDLSAILPDYEARYGIRKTNEILRRFGAERLLFGTDWPCSRSTAPSLIFERYMEILDQMDFSEEEMHMISHRNAESLLKIDKIG